VARRIGALLGIVVLLALVLMLIYDVYRHHEAGREMEEPAIVSLDVHAA